MGLLQKGCETLVRHRVEFPLVADNEPIVTEEKIMALYEETDLITNIHGFYEEKSFGAEEVYAPSNIQNSPTANHQAIRDAGKSYAEMAREQARQDVKKKRQAFLDMERKTPSKAVFKEQLEATRPKKRESNPVTSLNRLSQHLRQESYILAEVPKFYQEPQNDPVSQKKNNYDFLKKSQIYGTKGKQSVQNYVITQELNLTQFETTNE